jgi:antagonist of KipI
MIEIIAAPPYLSVQDAGRPGYRASGVPVSGAMDGRALAAANAWAGNARGAAALEWALAGGSIRFSHATRVALAGAAVEATLDGMRVESGRAYSAPSGAVLTITRLLAGRFLYVAVGGGIDVPLVMGSRSTYLAAKIGGHHGRLLRTGDAVPIGGTVGDPSSILEYSPGVFEETVRLVRGPQSAHLDDGQWSTLLSAPFRVSAASDRTGYRLDGPPLAGVGRGTQPSAPVRPGVVQLTEGGTLIVLMPDGPTVGGYSSVAVVPSADLAALAQRSPGETILFRETTVAEAEERARRYMAQAA